MYIDVLILLIIKFVNQNNYLFKSYILIHKQEIKKYVIRLSFGSSKNFKNSFFFTEHFWKLCLYIYVY